MEKKNSEKEPSLNSEYKAPEIEEALSDEDLENVAGGVARNGTIGGSSFGSSFIGSPPAPPPINH